MVMFLSVVMLVMAVLLAAAVVLTFYAEWTEPRLPMVDKVLGAIFGLVLITFCSILFTVFLGGVVGFWPLGNR